MSDMIKIALKIFVPVVIGISVVVWLFVDEYTPGAWSQIKMDASTIYGLLLACFFVFGRDFGLAWRFRAITDNNLSWWQSTKVTMMCEFSSAITPSAVGGSAVGMLFLNREGIEIGRATTLMMTTIFLDELFFVILCPIVLSLFNPDRLFFGFQAWGIDIKWIFRMAYAAILMWTVILFVGIFVKPNSIRAIFKTIFELRFMHRWQDKCLKFCDNMVTASIELKSKSPKWWLKVSLSTIISWLSRFLIVNALLLAFTAIGNQGLIFARQVVLWIALMFCPTPGGSGLSEELFTNYYGDIFLPALDNPESMAIIIALFWRIITYYVYLLIGIFLIPTFLKISGSK